MTLKSCYAAAAGGQGPLATRLTVYLSLALSLASEGPMPALLLLLQQEVQMCHISSFLALVKHLQLIFSWF